MCETKRTNLTNAYGKGKKIEKNPLICTKNPKGNNKHQHACRYSCNKYKSICHNKIRHHHQTIQQKINQAYLIDIMS